MKYIFSICILIGSIYNVSSQKILRSIEGIVVESSSLQPLPFASVIILDSEPLKGTVCDENGIFRIEDVPVGRYDVKASFLGYEDVIIKEVYVQSARRCYLEIQIKENPFQMDEVVIKSSVNKEKAINSMAKLSARVLSVEEAERYAGGFDDPARLASSFAGVSSRVGNNGIVIRGNAPKYLQWNLEGVEIPNPNHFANLSTLGGGGLTALSSHLISDSDFMTGAMPADYANALSGAFDIRMRKGNPEKSEHSFQVGLIGLDAASEGPLSKNKKSSYLFNYRYATLSLMESLLPEDAQGTSYQDIAFKLHFPLSTKNTLNIWGIGLLDRSGQIAERDTLLWRYEQDFEEQVVDQGMGAMGIHFRSFLNKKSVLNTILSASISGISLKTEQLNSAIILEDENEIKNINTEYTFTNNLTHVFSPKHTNRSGIKLRLMQYDLSLKEADSNKILQSIVDRKGSALLTSFYTTSSIEITPKWSTVLGISGQYFGLNGELSLEPRASFTFEASESLSMGMAYGLYSRMEPLSYYLIQDDFGNLINDKLALSKAHHFVLNFQLSLSDKWLIKIEPYYQYLFDIPIIPETNYSFINLEKDWFLDEVLTNDGKGKNYGIDLTLEKYMKNGFYTMLSASFFNTKYRNQTEWYDTRFNSNVVVNYLAGKEFYLGKNQNKILGINIRFTYQGGDPYTPIDKINSIFYEDVITDDSRPFHNRFDPSLITHFTINYKVNKKKTAHEFSLKVINAIAYKEFVDFRYDFIDNEVIEYRESLVIPNLSYKISF